MRRVRMDYNQVKVGITPTTITIIFNHIIHGSSHEFIFPRLLNKFMSVARKQRPIDGMLLVTLGNRLVMSYTVNINRTLAERSFVLLTS